MEHEKKIDITDELMTRYITGDASPDEALALSNWLSDEENRRQFNQLEKAWLQALPASKPAFNKSDAWGILSKRINHGSSEGKIRPLTIPNIGLFLKIAASFLLVGLTAWFVYIITNETAIRNLTVATTMESKTHTFSDQSFMTLYRNSVVDYPESFSEQTREINLTRGEAFFKISHDIRKPFIVHTPNGVVKVVGTEFDVAIENSNTEVSVKEGKVIVYTAADTVMLTAGLSAVVSSGKTEIMVKSVANVNVWGYATRKLVFNNTPLRDAIASIEKAYPNAISLSNKNIEKCNVTATFDNEPVDKIVNLVADILNLTVTKNGETFTLEGEGCP
ncbi:MAG: FecR domain-containing protein [Chryseolinea sp.]